MVETNVCPNISLSDISANSLECLPSTSWEMDSNADFSWNLSDSCKGKEKLKLKKEISPSALLRPWTWQHPEYVNFKKRLATFHDWPKFLRGPSKEDFARAGFFYTQIGDRVTCFSCGITLKNWDYLYDAYDEHLCISKNCTYVKMIIG